MIQAFNAMDKEERQKNSVFAFVDKEKYAEFKPSQLRQSPRHALAELAHRTGSQAQAAELVESGQYVLAKFHLYIERSLTA